MTESKKSPWVLFDDYLKPILSVIVIGGVLIGFASKIDSKAGKEKVSLQMKALSQRISSIELKLKDKEDKSKADSREERLRGRVRSLETRIVRCEVRSRGRRR